MRTSISESILDDLLRQAALVAEKSYSPYSGFRVGAALLLDDGKVVTGTNVENASFGLTVCAERTALVKAVSEFGPRIRITAVAVANLNGAASSPCGACRQTLAEFAERDALIAFPAGREIRTMRFDELLPLQFDMKLEK
ncbi:MAG: cytidine deaminase [Acidobacteria bacterium]|nr:cytidine deaminase [Acidobacteriota bacterium]